jgi:predicted nucleotidyltransferase
MRASSDIDICVYYDDEVDRASEFRLKVLSELFDDIYDIKIFQQMPVYARVEVLKERSCTAMTGNSCTTKPTRP